MTQNDQEQIIEDLVELDVFHINSLKRRVTSATQYLDFHHSIYLSFSVH